MEHCTFSLHFLSTSHNSHPFGSPLFVFYNEPLLLVHPYANNDKIKTNSASSFSYIYISFTCFIIELWPMHRRCCRCLVRSLVRPNMAKPSTDIHTHTCMDVGAATPSTQLTLFTLKFYTLFVFCVTCFSFFLERYWICFGVMCDKIHAEL